MALLLFPTEILIAGQYHQYVFRPQWLLQFCQPPSLLCRWCMGLSSLQCVGCSCLLSPFRAHLRIFVRNILMADIGLLLQRQTSEIRPGLALWPKALCCNWKLGGFCLILIGNVASSVKMPFLVCSCQQISMWGCKGNHECYLLLSNNNCIISTFSSLISWQIYRGAWT